MQSQVLRTFEGPISGPDGLKYVAKVCGSETADGRWVGWVEFIPEGGTPVLRSRRETSQSNLRSLERWAAGLRRVYLEGSLGRTLRMQEPRRRPTPPPQPEAPYFDGPSPDPAADRALAPDDTQLNPFVWYRRGESHLRDKLAELAPAELRMVARAYGFGVKAGVDLEALPRDTLVELIVAFARHRSK